MPSIDVKETVRQAVKDEWPRFEQNHPKLAAVVDETILVEQAAASIADDPEYQEAMENAAAMGAGAEIVTSVVQRLVGRWIRSIV